MLTLNPAIAAKIAGEKIDGVFWLVKLELESGDQYFAESGEFETGGHIWYPFLDPESPIDGVKQNLKCDEELDTSITLVNVNHGLSDLLASNDFQGKTARIYLYFREIDELLQVFRGVMGKPERVGDLAITVPVSSYLSGPKSKLPSNLFTRTCPAVFADGKYCPYNPAGGYGIVDPVTGLPFTSCPKSSVACASRGMRDAQGKDYFGGFERWSYTSSGRLNNTGFLGIGRQSYTSKASIQDNFLGQAIPLVYGEVRFPAKLYFWGDESEFLLVGGMIAEGQLQQAVQILANGQSTHDFKYPPYFTHGFPGQAMPVIGAYSADPFSGTSFAIIRIKDEVGIQKDRSVDMSVHVKGRIMRQYWRNGDHWSISEGVYSQAPTDVWIDLIANARGGLGLGYDVIDLDLNWERDYSNEIILDVDGVSRKRFTFNGVLLDHESAGDVLERLRDEFSMFFRDYGDSVRFGFIRPNLTSVFTFSEAARTVETEEKVPVIEVWEKPASDIPNRMYFSFLDASNGFEKTTFHLESPEQIARIGKVVDETVYLKATTNIGQALRIASNRMERTISGNWFAEWRAPLKALAVEVGDVVTLVTDLLPNGSDEFLVMEKEITPDFSIRFVGQLYRGEFYDDAVADTYDDILRGSPENPLRPPAEVTGLQAEETVVTVDGVNTSEIKVTYAKPDPVDPIWKEVEVWWRDTLSPDNSWTRAATSLAAETSAKFALPIRGYRMLEIRARAVSRYGICRDLDNTDVPEFDLLVDGTPDNNVPDAPVNFAVTTRDQDPTIPPGFYRATFDAGATNWAGVHTIYIEANETMPFSDGSIRPSGGVPVSGTGVIDAGGTTIFKDSAGWLPHDSSLVGCLAIVTDGGGNVQARYVVDNTADTVIVNGPWYLPDGSYSFEVRSDFSKINFRHFVYAASQGDFPPSARSFTFDLPVTDTSLYFRICVYNAFGKSPWVTLPDPVSNFAVDTTPAALVTGFTVTPQGYTLPDGTQKVMVNISFDQPDPKLNFSHIIVFADRPIEGIHGKEGETGWWGAAGKYKEIVGEVYEAGTPVIMEPSKADEDSWFYAVSVNQDGFYPADWMTTGIDNPGGCRFAACKVLAEDTAPPASASVVAAYNPGAGINVVWDTIGIPDLDHWEIEEKTAATEGDLAGASWVPQSENRSTLHQRFVLEPENGYWFQFRVRAVDNTGHLGAWAESNHVQAYAGASVQPVAVPLNLVVTGIWKYQMGVPISFISVNWDNPSDPNYGGVQVWIVDLTQPAGVLYDVVKVTPGGSSNSTLTLLMDGHVLKVRLIPFNRSGIVPDFGTYLDSEAWTNNPETFGYTVPAPDITARDGVGCVHLQVEVPAWPGMSNPYSSLLVFISKTSDSSGAQLVGRWPVNNASGTPERMFIDIPFQALADVTGGPWVTGAQYYFFGKMEGKDGGQSAFSVDTDYSAIFIGGGLTEDGAPDFGANAEVMRIVAAEDRFTVGWNAPTVYGTTVYLSRLQVSRNSTFTSLVEDFSVNAKSGSRTVVVPEPGTYYVRVCYTNNSAAGTSEWFGLREGASPAYATVATVAGQSGDTSYINGASYLTGYYERIEQSDSFRVYFKMSSSATNCATWWNTTALWSDTESKLNDANYIVQSPITAAWADYDSWISTGSTTPLTSWIGKVFQYKKNTTPEIWASGIITQVDTTNKKVQVNVNFGPARTGQTARVITGYWERAGVYFEEVSAPNGGVLQKNVDYYLQTAINQFPSPATVYFKLIPYNAVYGPGTAETFNVTTQQMAYDIVTKGQGYANDTVPVATFSGNGSQWDVAANNSVDLLVSFTLTHNAQLDPNLRPDSIVIVAKIGASAPTDVNDNTNTRKFVFPVTHLSGAQGYLLKCPGFDPFTAYSYKAWHAKNCASGMVVGTASVITVTNIKYTSGRDLLLAPIGASGLVKVMNNSATDYAAIAAGQVIFYDVNGVYCASVWQSGSDGGLRFGFSHPNVDPDNELQITRTGSEFRLQSGAGHIIRAFDAPMQAARFVADYSGYASPFIMGSYFIWVDTSGKLRIKSGAPTGDTDGTVVGTQS